MRITKGAQHLFEPLAPSADNSRSQALGGRLSRLAPRFAQTIELLGRAVANEGIALLDLAAKRTDRKYRDAHSADKDHARHRHQGPSSQSSP
jgi:hypothetical protein